MGEGLTRQPRVGNTSYGSGPGQSGDPGSPHYRDLIERWARNEPAPMLSSRRAVERAAERRIELRPG